MSIVGPVYHMHATYESTKLTNDYFANATEEDSKPISSNLIAARPAREVAMTRGAIVGSDTSRISTRPNLKETLLIYLPLFSTILVISGTLQHLLAVKR